MTGDFSRLKVSDGQITEVVLVGDEVRLSLDDWREQKMVVTFEGVVGIEAVGTIGVDLGHAGESADDPFIQKSCGQADVPVAGLRCFTLSSAWTGETILRVVAHGFRI